MNQIDRKAAPPHRADPAQSNAGVAEASFHLRFHPPFLTLGDGGSQATLDVSIPATIRADDLYLVADIYLSDRHAHPAGHVGWWSFAIASGTTIALDVLIEGRQMRVLARDGREIDRWVNPDFALPPSETLVMHLVYRQRHNHAIVHSQSLHIYRDATISVAAARIRASIEGDLSPVALLPRAAFQWPSGSTIRVVAQGMPPVARMARNGVALQLAKLLTRETIPCRLYAASFDPDLRGAVSHIGDLAEDAAADDLVVILYDDYLRDLPWLCRLPCTKILYFLGLPISTRLQAFDAEAYEHYVKARAAIRHIVDCDIWAAATREAAGQLARYLAKALLPGDEGDEPGIAIAPNTDLAGAKAAISKILARLAPADRRRLEEHIGSTADLSADAVAVCERIIARQVRRCREPDRGGIWQAAETVEAPDLAAPGPVLLYSGRLSPGEGVLESIELFVELHKIAANSHLVIAGDHPVLSFLHYVEYLLNTRFAGIKNRVTVLADVDDSRLKALYRRADALLHLGPSGADLLGDAVHFAKPLFTAGGPKEKKSRAVAVGYRFYDSDRPGQAARLQKILNDKEALSGLLECQRRDLAALEAAPDNLPIWALLELAAARIGVS